MALSKRIELDNGVAVNYHRVASVNIITNHCNIIEVASYTSSAKREEERAALESGEPMNVYIESSFHSAEYDQAMTVQSAYDWLKSSTEEFAGAEDVVETADSDVIGDSEFMAMLEEVL